MKRFDELYKKLLETMTAGGEGSILNPDQNKGYADGDERFVFGNPNADLFKKKKPQKRKLKNTL